MSASREPDRADALHGLALRAAQAGDDGEALRLVDQALALRPAEARLHYLKGRLQRRGGHDALALDSYRTAVECDPGLWEAHSSLGVCLKALGRFAESAAAQQRALELQPAFAEGWLNLGNALFADGQCGRAEAAYARALALRPGLRKAEIGHATAGAFELLVQGRWSEAAAQLEAACARYPEVAALHCGLGSAWWQLGRFDEAQACFDQALQQRPDDVHASMQMANMLNARGLPEQAIAWFERAQQILPDHPFLHSDRAVALLNAGRIDESEQALRRAVALAPELALAQYNLGIVHLLQGRLPEGFAGYEARFAGSDLWRDRPAPSFPARRWDGRESLAGKRLLLWTEQGLGDTLQFLRYLPWILQQAPAAVELHVQAPLLPLLAAQPHWPGLTLKAMGETIGEVDLECPLLSLPHRAGTDLAAIPPQRPPLQADPGLRQAWRLQLAQRTPAGKPRVGLVWAGNPDHPRDGERSLALDRLQALRGSGAALVSLQLGAAARQAAQWPELVDAAAGLRDFADTAALLCELDLLISVDTSAAHLAGVLGRPCWLLLTCVPDWRWLRERADSPWYPDMRLFRQPQRGDWDAPIRTLAEALTKWVGERAIRAPDPGRLPGGG